MFRYSEAMSAAWILVIGMVSIGCQSSEEKAPGFSKETSREVVTVTEALQSSEALCDFAVYSKEFSNLRDRVTSWDGYIGSAGQVEIGNDTRVTGDIESVGKVTIRDRSVVDGDVTTGNVVYMPNPSTVTITGTVDEHASLSTYSIPTKSVSYGTQDVNVYNGQTNNLSPGRYDEIHVYGGGTLKLRSGIYNARLFIVESSTARLKMEVSQGPVEVNVNGELRFGDNMVMSLIGGVESRDVKFYSNYTGQVRMGTGGTFHGIVTVPNGEVYAYSRMDMHGAIYAKRVTVDTDVMFYGSGCEDPCEGVVCDTPPSDYCVNGSALSSSQ